MQLLLFEVAQHHSLDHLPISEVSSNLASMFTMPMLQNTNSSLGALSEANHLTGVAFRSDIFDLDDQGFWKIPTGND